VKCALAVIATFCVTLAASAQSVITAERDTPQLFVDDFLIESQQDVQRTLHQPIKDANGDGPVIALGEEVGDVPATLEANGTIVYDPRLKKHVMFALAFLPTTPGIDRVRLYRFTSDDAMKWIKGDDGKAQHTRFDLSDPASGTSASNIDLFSCFYDKADADFPYKGWVWLANWGEREGFYYVRSRDGLAWKRGALIARHNSRRIEQDGRTLTGPSDVTIFYPDPVTHRFLALLKFNAPTPINGSALRSRGYLFVDRLDQPIDLQKITRVALVPAAAAQNGDMPDDEYYGSTAWRYGSIWLGALKVWHRAGDYPYSAAGCAFFKLAASRDGLDWKKVQFANDAAVAEIFIANGREGGNNGRNDGGYMTDFSQGPLRIGDELIFYYGCSSWGKNHPPGKRVTGGGIFRARLRPDGFVSVDRGSITTKPLEVRGENLLVNAVGPIAIELLDPAGAIIASANVDGDSLRHAVKFNGSPIRAFAAKGPLRLRFQIGPGGRLYSFSAG
jgi:hypothetical protein